MALRSREVYKGKHKRRSILAIVLFIVAVLLVGAVVMFYSFQKYVVYGQDGVTVEQPILATAAPAAESGGTEGFETVNAELVVDQPDYSGVAATAGADTPQLKALFVPAEEVNAEGIDAAVNRMSAYGASALVLEMRPRSGQLPYASAAPMAVSYGLSGTLDMTDILASLKEKNIYLAAQVSCCVDDLLASRDPLVALRNAYGGVYADGGGDLWLDPFNPDVRTYAADLGKELAAMGFDEIIYRYLEQPDTSDALVYTQKLSFTPTPLAGVCGFAVSLTNALSGTDAVISAALDSDSLHNSLSAATGQDPELFLKVFDRVCCWEDLESQYAADRDALSAYVTVGDLSARFAPMMAAAPSNATSWIVKTQ